MRRIIDFFIIPLGIILVLVIAVVWVQKSSFTHKTTQDYIKDLNATDTQRRWFAAYSLGKSENPGECVGPLLNALKDPSREVRWHVAVALGNLKDERSVPHLAKLLEDPDEGVKICAARSLGLLGNSQALPALITALRHQNSMVRLTSAWALGNIGDKAVITTLKPLLDDSSKEVVDQVACVLARLGSSSGKSVLEGMLRSEDEAVQRSAKEALKLLKQSNE